ncbi:MAG: hypothetical protein MUF54_00280 [Polyangiaceae bacterium]|jgi:hypothetical protein|nr:hypothetical protein [Polyangiaceae bacterium]
MGNLLLQDLQLGLNDLLTKREQLLLSCSTGMTYAPLFRARRDAIEALPDVLVGRRPLAGSLAERDACHDAYGAAVYHLSEAYVRLASYEPEFAAEAQRIRAALVPSLAGLRISFAGEAVAAQNRLKKLSDLKPLLESFPVKGGNLYRWATQYLEAGVSLDELMSSRADATATTDADRRIAGVLRSETLGLLARARAALGDELQANVSLPRNLDAAVFGYFDELAAMRDRSASRGDDGAPAKQPVARPPGE